jgi:hypothetical protein
VHDIKPGDRKWFEETLPSKTYETPDDVMTALGWEIAPPARRPLLGPESRPPSEAVVTR